MMRDSTAMHPRASVMSSLLPARLPTGWLVTLDCGSLHEFTAKVATAQRGRLT